MITYYYDNNYLRGNMNKLVIAIVSATAIFASAANAEYMVKIPLERNQGGFLADNSISFVPAISGGENETPEPEPTPPAATVLTDAQIIDTINSYGDASITFASRNGSVIVNYPIAKDYGCTFSNSQRDSFESYFHSTNNSKYGKSVLVEYSFYGTCN
ncbi:hypothetical protein [Pseudomonas aeruginosa]